MMTVAGPPRIVATNLRKLLPANLHVAPAPLADKLAVLRKGGIVVRDLPGLVPRVTVAKPVNGDLSLSFYSVFGVATDVDYALTEDGKGFIGINFNGVPGAVYLADCELPSVPTTTKIEVAIDGGGWLPATVANGHLLYALPTVPENYPAARAFAFRSPNGGFGFHGCEVTKVK
jgi:hypothetical protein